MHFIINGRMVTAAKAVIPMHDRGFRYGDGVFETIAVHDGVPYQYDWHMARLAAGLGAIKIPFATDGLRDHCRRLLKKNALKNAILRIQVTRGIGSRGYLPEAADATFVMETMPLPEPPPEPVSLWQSSYCKLSQRALPVRFKLCQGLNSTLARLEAAQNDCFDALMLNERSQLSETSSANLFWFKDDTLYTPALSCGILEGATRAAIMRLSPYPVREVEIGVEALREADSLFLTNTVWQAVAVNALLPLNWRWPSEPITEELRRLLAGDRQDYCRTHKEEW